MTSGDAGLQRSRALDAWDYRAPFARYHIHWGDGDLTPAFEALQAYGIVRQELELERQLSIWAHREVLVTFSSENVRVGGAPAEREPAWVVIVAGTRIEGSGTLDHIPVGSGAMVQVLLHARSGEVLLGAAVPVRLRS